MAVRTALSLDFVGPNWNLNLTPPGQKAMIIRSAPNAVADALVKSAIYLGRFDFKKKKLFLGTGEGRRRRSSAWEGVGLIEEIEGGGRVYVRRRGWGARLPEDVSGGGCLNIFCFRGRKLP